MSKHQSHIMTPLWELYRRTLLLFFYVEKLLKKKWSLKKLKAKLNENYQISFETIHAAYTKLVALRVVAKLTVQRKTEELQQFMDWYTTCSADSGFQTYNTF